MKPTIGRIVHFVLANGQHRAATVTNAWPNSPQNSSCNLSVHLDAANDLAFETDLSKGVQGRGAPALKPEVAGDVIGGIYLGGADLHLASIRGDARVGTEIPGKPPNLSG